MSSPLANSHSLRIWDSSFSLKGRKALSSRYVPPLNLVYPNNDFFSQTNISYPLQPQPENLNLNNFYKPQSEITFPTPSKLAQYRKLVSSSKVGKVQVGEAASEVCILHSSRKTDDKIGSQHIQDDFVRERQDDKNVTPDDLIMRMTIAKFVLLYLFLRWD